MKRHDHKAIKHFIDYPSDLDRCWQSYKVAARHGYTPNDYRLWSDLIRLLGRCGKDIHYAKYICPDNLQMAHDHWQSRVTAMEGKRRNEEQMRRAKAQEADFYKLKSRFFGIVIQDGDIEISVLNSIEAYKAEGECLHHCVFKCEYYAKQESLILSAHDRIINLVNTNAYRFMQAKASA